MSAKTDESHTAFLRLYSANEPSLRGFVRSLLPTREDAREVMQEVALVLWRKFGELASEDDFRAWAFTVARYEVLAWRRDKARDRLVFDDDTLQRIAEKSSSLADHLDARREALEHCLAKLPDDQRELVRRAYAPETRMDQLARQLGRTAMSLYKSLHRIRMTLVECTRRVLAPEEFS
jgi:RNA polymerase sigma-70 factor, ECF subfamily